MSDDFSAWVGSSEERSDVLEPARSNALRAALGDTGAARPSAPLPLLHHWLYFWDVRPPAGLGVDGHPAKGGFLPPVPLPRRMWAGGRLKFLQPLHLGERVTRARRSSRSRARAARAAPWSSSRSRTRLAGERGAAIDEEQDLVYREPAAPGSIAAPAGRGAAPAAPWHREIMPDPVLLFRYSALTMNGHRIHYDLPYATGEESLSRRWSSMARCRRRCSPTSPCADLGQAAGDLRLPRPGRRRSTGTLLHVCGEPTEDGAQVWTEQGGNKNMIATATTA